MLGLGRGWHKGGWRLRVGVGVKLGHRMGGGRGWGICFKKTKGHWVGQWYVKLRIGITRSEMASMQDGRITRSEVTGTHQFGDEWCTVQWVTRSEVVEAQASGSLTCRRRRRGESPKGCREPSVDEAKRERQSR